MMTAPGEEEGRPGYEVWDIDDDIIAVKRAIELMTDYIGYLQSKKTRKDETWMQ